MITKTMQVFYDTLCLPYKDKERSIHFPVIGGAFQGASNTTQIKFYIDELGQPSATWVAMAKLPNGKIGSKVLSTYLDSELNENYALLQLDSWFTQAKGDVYISLQGFEGGVQLTYNSETELYEVNGTPVIQGTGSVKVNIMYATQFSGDTNMSIDISDILALAGDKLDTDKGIVVIANTSANVSGYEDNQIFYCLADNSVYKKVSGVLTQIFTAYSKTESDSKYFINASNNTASGNNTFSGTNTFSGQNTFSGRAVFSGNANLYNTYLTTNTKNYFARVGTTTNQYVMYKLPYNYGDVGEQSYTLITKEYTDNQLSLKADKSDTYTKSQTDTLLNNKADKATTLSGYGITNAYTKSETDSAIASAVSSAYIYKGTKTVSEINALDTSDLVVGWVYNVSDSGTITLGSLSVNAGDNIAWTGNAWDILAGVVDLSDYYTSSQVDTLLSGYVDITNAQTITGTKTFKGDLKFVGASYTSEGVLTTDNSYAYLGFGGANTLFAFNGSRFLSNNVSGTDLGASNRLWKDLYLSGELKDGTNSIAIANIVPKTRTIAGISLASDISSQDLTNALTFATNTDIDNLL